MYSTGHCGIYIWTQRQMFHYGVISKTVVGRVTVQSVPLGYAKWVDFEGGC